MSLAFVFPGQGSQAVGMGQALAEAFPVARHTLQEVDDALGQHLSRVMFEGPEEELRLTANAQPALMAVSLAALRVLEQEGGKPMAERAAFVAGHSLGEYSALAAAGALELADAAVLLRRRGQAMQEAVPVGQGAMAALLGLDLEVAQGIAEAAAEDQVCAAANDNAPGQVVLSGHSEAIDRAIALAQERGAKRAILLPVSAPFHCALMAPAADVMADALAAVSIKMPSVPLIANVTAARLSDSDEIRRKLVEQVTGMVRWRESVAFMASQGVEKTVELGAGKVLTGLTKQIDRDLVGVAAGTPEEMEKLLQQL
ncbi:ACP S-malonyltransferase [Pelagibius litoralis]|uniref:Malonyl CoA-acyl carrier protein transacylase n=1 Tax=Pelagibius litoralis TaxID=374515 RepID=A0A967KDM8_9PROT|nr:ACP S-malonyltransferase [Pelagibius litoralis]NIA70305.1 ACP S-malonyltransferase [Pelagibius litoralis]